MRKRQTPSTRTRHGQTSIALTLRQRLSEAQEPITELFTERGIAREFDVSRLTARRAMRELVRSGHLRVAPRRGYWPASPLDQVDPSSLRIACVKTGAEPPSAWAPHIAGILTTVQSRVQAIGGTVTLVAEPDPASGALNQRLLADRINGVILDCEAAHAAVIAAGLSMPCVVVNTPTEPVAADVVVQDNVAGGYLAASHLLAMGHRRIAWLGEPPDGAHARERLGGFLSAFVERGLRFDPQWAAFVSTHDHSLPRRELRRLLAHGPTALVVLWTELSARAWQAVHEAGMKVPDDLSFVSWGAHESIPSRWEQLRQEADAPLPDTVEWRIADLADSALSRLTERMRNPAARPVKIFLPVRLQIRGSVRRIEADTPAVSTK